MQDQGIPRSSGGWQEEQARRVARREERERERKKEEEDPRQKEIQKRLADQKRRSELMHAKIEPRDRKLSSEKPRSTFAPSHPSTLGRSPTQPIPIPLPIPPALVDPMSFTPYQAAPYQTPIPGFVPLSPVRSIPPFQPPLPTSTSPPRQRQPPVPIPFQPSFPSPPLARPSPPRSKSTPLLPPRNLVVVPPPPPEPSPPLANSDPPVLLHTASTSPPPRSATVPLPSPSSKQRTRSHRLSTIEPLIKDVRPPAAWSLPHAPSVSGRKTADNQER